MVCNSFISEAARSLQSEYRWAAQRSYPSLACQIARQSLTNSAQTRMPALDTFTPSPDSKFVLDAGFSFLFRQCQISAT